MRSRGRISYFAIFFVGIIFAGYYYSHNYLFTLDTPQNRSEVRKWDYPTVVVKAIAGEFKGIVADLLLIESAALVGMKVQKVRGGGHIAVNTKPDLETILRLLNHSIALDPYFQQTYISAQGWLPWYGDPYIIETNKILKVAEKSRWWDWQPSRFIGFNTYYFLDDVGGAGKIYLEAGKIKNAPPFLAILGARLAQEGHQTEAAIALMKNMLQNKSGTDPGYDAIFDRLRDLEGTFIIETGVKKFKERFGTVPKNPEDLIRVGIIAKLPFTPDNIPFCIDVGGTVYFDRPHCRE